MKLGDKGGREIQKTTSMGGNGGIRIRSKHIICVYDVLSVMLCTACLLAEGATKYASMWWRDERGREAVV